MAGEQPQASTTSAATLPTSRPLPFQVAGVADRSPLWPDPAPPRPDLASAWPDPAPLDLPLPPPPTPPPAAVGLAALDVAARRPFLAAAIGIPSLAATTGIPSLATVAGRPSLVAAVGSPSLATGAPSSAGLATAEAPSFLATGATLHGRQLAAGAPSSLTAGAPSSLAVDFPRADLVLPRPVLASAQPTRAFWPKAPPSVSTTTLSTPWLSSNAVVAATEHAATVAAARAGKRVVDANTDVTLS
ncbi:hypothetical protein GUJ93_ZPchr0001g30322 [Zizania palustris]|uniref:Uncharacterized protein n=1 Tax=Zizania palustris TaxID=103762 RepID=A0A8J5RQV1_ZIZPA|nr:hypothetical protein GUJ93_ZPchr0001g30322 [Zizania palustris]